MVTSSPRIWWDVKTVAVDAPPHLRHRKVSLSARNADYACIDAMDRHELELAENNVAADVEVETVAAHQ